MKKMNSCIKQIKIETGARDRSVAPIATDAVTCTASVLNSICDICDAVNFCNQKV